MSAEKMRDIDRRAVERHIEQLTIKTGAALAICHENADNDRETLCDALQDINLIVWRIRWVLYMGSRPESEAVR